MTSPGRERSSSHRLQPRASASRPGVRLAIALLLAVGLTLAPASSARACHDSLTGPVTFACFAGLYAMAATAVFVPAEIIIAAADGTWLPPEWAITQLLVAGAPAVIAGVASMALSGSTNSSAEQAELIGWGIVSTVVGAWHLLDSILSLLLYESPVDEEESDSSSFRPAIFPIAGGAALQIAGRF